MISRHQIRQTAVQFLYGVGISPEGENIVPECDFSSWDIVLEPARADLAKARAKAVEHLTRDRADKLRVFQTRVKDAVLAMKDDLTTSDLRDTIQDILKRETSLDEAIKAVRVVAKDMDKSEFASIGSSFDSLFLVNETLIQLRGRLLTAIQDQPGYASVLSSLASSIKRMQEISERLAGIKDPEKSLNPSEIAKVVEGSRDLIQIQQETEKLVKSVLSQLHELDETIASVTDNFSPGRVSPVDRSILRIAAYELKNCPELPLPVIIKEAILLAESYSVKEATKFVNGVLAGVAGVYRNNN